VFRVNSRLFSVVHFGKRACDFLLVINSNVYYLTPFEDTMAEMLKIASANLPILI